LTDVMQADVHFHICGNKSAVTIQFWLPALNAIKLF